MTNTIALICLCSWYNCASPTGCASWAFPLGTVLRITERHNGSSVIVKVIERGPGPKPLREGVSVDLSKEAFERLDGLSLGRAEVSVEVCKLEVKWSNNSFAYSTNKDDRPPGDGSTAVEVCKSPTPK